MISYFIFFVLFRVVRIQCWIWRNPQRLYLFSQRFWRAGTVCEQGKKKRIQKRPSTGVQLMVQCLVRTFSFFLTPRMASCHTQSLAITTLFQLQWWPSWQTWAGIKGSSHLMRWRYFILTHPAKCKITRTEFN